MKALSNFLFVFTLGVAIASIALFFFSAVAVNWQMMAWLALIPGIWFLILDTYLRGHPDEEV